MNVIDKYYGGRQTFQKAQDGNKMIIRSSVYPFVHQQLQLLLACNTTRTTYSCYKHFIFFGNNSSEYIVASNSIVHKGESSYGHNTNKKTNSTIPIASATYPCLESMSPMIEAIIDTLTAQSLLEFACNPNYWVFHHPSLPSVKCIQ